jgi:leucyl/phenylalanyl-tRNA--protein transferase
MDEVEYIYSLDNSLSFPNPSNASKQGLLAWGGDLSPQRLIKAYKNGIFPWYGKDDPILWWSPDPRMIMYLDDFKLSKSLKRVIKNSGYIVKKNKNFKQVMIESKHIKRDDQDGTWINDDMIKAYTRLHELGYAWSYETYLDDKLIGGLYGVVIKNIFFGESMFAHKSNASKVAYSFLVDDLKDKNFAFIDCQTPSEHLRSLGAVEISRIEFLQLLKTAQD